MLSITYTVTGGITAREYGDTELYRNITEHFKGVRILSTQVTLTAASRIMTPARACYMDHLGLATSCTAVIASSSAPSVVFRHGMLIPGDSMVIAQTLDAQYVSTERIERYNSYFYIVLILAGVLGLLAWYLYYFQYKDRFNVLAYDARSDLRDAPDEVDVRKESESSDTQHTVVGSHNDNNS